MKRKKPADRQPQRHHHPADLAPLVEAFAAWQDASTRAQAVLDGVQREHAIVEAAKAQAAAIVEGPRAAYVEALTAAARG